MSILRVLGVVVGIGLATTMAARAETRVALVIGNGAYQNVTHLANPANDAKLIAAALQQDGFSVTHADDLDRDGLAKALRAFGHEADGADWAVIYYAGHGIEMGGTNYLIPVDARLETDRDVGLEAVPLDQVMSAIEGARSLRLVILDACRNNPFAATIKRTAGTGRDIGRGLGRVEPAQATLVAYSAKDGSIAADGDGANSPYAAALGAHLTEPGLEVDKLFRLVRDDVQEATGKNQEPFVYGSLPGRQDFYFQPPAGAASGTAGAAVVGNDPIAADYLAAAAVGTIAAWDAFLELHGSAPENFYVKLAKAAEQKLAALEPPPHENPKPPTLPACDGGLVASVDNAGVAAAAERCLKPKDVFRDCENCPEMVVIPAGNFTMGSPSSEKGRADDEGPQHEVRIGAPFAVGKFEITRGQFTAFVNDTGYKPGDTCWVPVEDTFADTKGRSFRDPGFKQDDSHPAVCISWDDAKAYVAWLAKTTGKSYRLPSEAEYEYATRAGTTTAYFFGNDPSQLCDYAHGANQTAKAQFPAWDTADCKDGYVYTAPVGSFAANDFGLYDMIGNVWEWTEDCYHDSYAGAPHDGSAWSSGSCDYRARRGGAWGSRPGDLRAASRDWDPPDNRFVSGGFRVARTL